MFKPPPPAPSASATGPCPTINHKMAEGHVESYLSVCVCVFQNRVQAITLPYMMGFDNNLAQNDYHDKTMCREQEPHR